MVIEIQLNSQRLAFFFEDGSKYKPYQKYKNQQSDQHGNCLRPVNTIHGALI